LKTKVKQNIFDEILTDNRNNQVTKTGVLSEDIGHLSNRVSFPFSTNSRGCLLLGTDHLTCRGVMVFCFVQNFFPIQHKS
jgi:hypothetical protein